jgi:hypothetical protein
MNIQKIGNKIIESLLKVLLKYYKRPGGPIVLSTDAGQVLLEFDKEEGPKSWIPGHPFPFPGMPDSVVVETMSMFKRIFPIIYKYGWVILRDRLPDYLRIQSQDANIGLIDPMHYSRPIRELHRAFTLMRNKEGEDQIEMRGKWTEMRDILCMFFEFDDAYRFRFQEMMLTLNREEFKFSPSDRYWSEKKWKYNFAWKNNKEFWREANLGEKPKTKI